MKKQDEIDFNAIRIGGFRSYKEFIFASLLEYFGQKYKYESDFFHLKHGVKYLPDFSLDSCYVEIKAKKPNRNERKKARYLSLATPRKIGIIDGRWKADRKYTVYQFGKATKEYFDGNKFCYKRPTKRLKSISLELSRLFEAGGRTNKKMIFKIKHGDRTVPKFVQEAASHNYICGWEDYLTGGKAPNYYNNTTKNNFKLQESWFTSPSVTRKNTKKTTKKSNEHYESVVKDLSKIFGVQM